MIDKLFGHVLGARIVTLAKYVFRLEHEVGGFDVVTVRIVIGNWTPVIGEKQVHRSRLNTDLVSNQRQHLFQTLAQRVILPYCI